MTSLATLPAFAAYLAVALGLLAIFLAAYTALTPCPEWSLIRAGNTAAAVSLSGAMLGFCLPLGSAIAHSVGLADLLVWGVVALSVQVLAFLAARVVLHELWQAIGRGEMASAVMMASLSTAVGLLNAACLTY